MQFTIKIEMAIIEQICVAESNPPSAVLGSEQSKTQTKFIYPLGHTAAKTIYKHIFIPSDKVLVIFLHV